MNTTATKRGRHVSDGQPNWDQVFAENHNQRFPDGCGNDCDKHEGRGKRRAEVTR